MIQKTQDKLYPHLPSTACFSAEETPFALPLSLLDTSNVLQPCNPSGALCYTAPSTIPKADGILFIHPSKPCPQGNASEGQAAITSSSWSWQLSLQQEYILLTMRKTLVLS